MYATPRPFCHTVENLDPLGELPSLEELKLIGDTSVSDISPLASATSLKVVDILACRSYSPPSHVFLPRHLLIEPFPHLSSQMPIERRNIPTPTLSGPSPTSLNLPEIISKTC